MRQMDGKARFAYTAHSMDRLDGDDVRGSPSLAERCGEPPEFIAPSGPRSITRQVVRNPARRPRRRLLAGPGAGQQGRGGRPRQDSLVDSVQSAAGVETDVTDD